MLEVSSQVNGDVNEVKLVGRLDVRVVQEAEAAFETAAAAAPNIMLDMSELDYIASAGLRALKRLNATAHDNGGTLTLCKVQPDVMDVFELTGFSAILNIE